MDVVRRITELIEPAVGDLGYEIVRVTFRSGVNATLQIMAERVDGVRIVQLFGAEERTEARFNTRNTRLIFFDYKQPADGQRR